MKQILLITLCLFLIGKSFSQNLYFPPLVGKNWDTLSAKEMGWCTDKLDTLYDYLGSTQTKSFMVLVDGKIVLEKYFGTFNQDSSWYWASAGKTLTAMVVGIAQQEGFLNLNDSTSKYLGAGWTSLSQEKEGLISIRNQLTMTNGLDDGIAINKDCTLKSCLQYKANAGERWAYHNAPYTLLDQVVSNATQQTYQQYFNNSIRNKTAISGLWLKVDYNNVFFSNTRSMARYGLLLLNRGKWDQTEVLTDTNYFNQMTKPSQNLNRAYGYLTWLNGSSNYMLPGTQLVFNGMLAPNAPADMYAALGKNGQILMVVPSKKLLVIRMGNDPDDGSLVPTTYANNIWVQLNKVICNGSNALSDLRDNVSIQLFPNPTEASFSIEGLDKNHLKFIQIYDTQGRLVQTETNAKFIDISRLAAATYYVEISLEKGKVMRKIVKTQR